MLPKKATTHQILETEAEENSSSCDQEDAAGVVPAQRPGLQC